ncbi:bile acid:sodium symporter family protein [Desulfatitalea alkaliphila]|uniref:Bile acid:sodium symporter n=1 Tax=Desulfatitalea alkaliphila TaxID=2929485 RepID=A0AA41R2B6_9BACT|nr:bile acid:sodium symporter [Desulfatitalea alkaliphila]
MALKRWMAQNWFLIGLAAVVLLAWLLPEPGAAGGVLRSQVLTRLGVVLIFFFQGLTLSLKVLRMGLLQWRLHLFVQVFVFLVIPLLALVLVTVGGACMTEELRLGFILLAVLPTTIATSVAYTGMTGGNVAGAVFNSTFANMAGIFITPMWIGIWLQAGGQSLPLGKLFLDISLMLLAPLLAGQIVRPFVSKRVDRHKKKFSTAASLIILFIVYAAFCNSWKQNIWSAQGTEIALVAAAGAILLFAAAVTLSVAGTRLLRFNHENSMAAWFCAPQKTLAAGAPLANLIFAGHPGLSLILLPIMFYHPLQLLAGGVLINLVNKRRQTASAAAGDGDARAVKTR